jgi:hypothetical protein
MTIRGAYYTNEQYPVVATDKQVLDLKPGTVSRLFLLPWLAGGEPRAVDLQKFRKVYSKICIKIASQPHASQPQDTIKI